MVVHLTGHRLAGEHNDSTTASSIVIVSLPYRKLTLQPKRSGSAWIEALILWSFAIPCCCLGALQPAQA